MVEVAGAEPGAEMVRRGAEVRRHGSSCAGRGRDGRPEVELRRPGATLVAVGRGPGGLIWDRFVMASMAS